MKSGNLNFLEPSGPLQACNGTALPLPYRDDSPDDEQQACSKHVEAYYRSKLIENSASCWFILYGYITMHGQQNIKFRLLDVCLSVHRCICMEKKTQLDVTECFIALMIRSTCFGHFYAHHQELENTCVSLLPMVCSAWLVVGRGQVQGSRL